MNRSSKLTRARALEIASLDRGSTRRKLGQFRIEGLRAVESAILAGASLLEVIVAHDLLESQRLDQVRGAGCKVQGVDSRTASKLSSVVQDQGIIAVAEIPSPDPDWMADTSRIVALDGIQDPGNVGTIVRCAAWFGLDAVVAGTGTADFFNPKTVRSMAGSMWDVTLVGSDDLVGDLKELSEAGFEVAAADLDGEPLANWVPRRQVVLVLGSEAHGISLDAARIIERSVRIEGPTGSKTGVESLNVAVAAGIMMYRIRG